jgi:hypothetical protein
VRGSDADRSPVAHVGPLCSLAHNNEVDGAGIGEGGCYARQQRGRTQVHVVVERKAQAEQKAALDDAPGQACVARVSADRAEEDRLVGAQARDVLIGEDTARGQVVAGSERVLGGFEDNVGGGCGVQHTHGFGNNLRSDSIAGKEGKADSSGHTFTVVPLVAWASLTSILTAMSIGTGIFLFVVGAVLAFALNFEVSWIDLDLVGYLLMGAGAIIFIIGIVLAARKRESTTTVRSGINENGENITQRRTSTTPDETL